MEIFSKRSTVIKAKQIDSALLKSDEIAWVAQNQKLRVKTVSEEKAQHRFISLEVAIDKIQEGFVYAPHWEFANPTPKGDVILNVPYFSQLDNSTGYHGPGSRQCNLTSNAMAAEFILRDRSMTTLSTIAQQEKLSEPESAYGRLLYLSGDTISHEANTQALHSLGLDSFWSTQLTIADIVASINKRLPMPIGVAYKSSGHILCAVGYNLDRQIIYVNDPYGARAGSEDYYAVTGGSAGKLDIYSFETMRKIWAEYSDGWGRVYTAIGGVKTGL